MNKLQIKCSRAGIQTQDLWFRRPTCLPLHYSASCLISTKHHKYLQTQEKNFFLTKCKSWSSQCFSETTSDDFDNFWFRKTSLFSKRFYVVLQKWLSILFTQNEMLDQSSRLHLWTFKLQRNTKTTWKSLADEKPKLKPKLTKNMSNCAMNALSYVRWSTKQKHSWVARNKIVILLSQCSQCKYRCTKSMHVETKIFITCVLIVHGVSQATIWVWKLYPTVFVYISIKFCKHWQVSWSVGFNW